MATITKHSTKTRREKPHRLQPYQLTDGWSVGALNIVSPRHPEESQDAFWPSDFTGPYQPLDEKATYGDFQPRFDIMAEMLQEYGELYILADGVEGCADGAAAARLAVTTVAHDYYHNNSPHALKDPTQRIDLLKKAVIAADKQLKQWNESYYCYAQEQHPDRRPRRYPYPIAARADFRCPICSTTLVTLQCTLIAVDVQKNKIWAVSVGGARIFTLYRQGLLGDIIPPQPYQFIGWTDFDPDTMICSAHQALHPSSYLGLCTDGVTDVLERLYTDWSHELVTRIKEKSLSQIVPELMLGWDEWRQNKISDVIKDDMTLILLSSPLSPPESKQQEISLVKESSNPLSTEIIPPQSPVEIAYQEALTCLNQTKNIPDLLKSRRLFISARDIADDNVDIDTAQYCSQWIPLLIQIEKTNKWLAGQHQEGDQETFHQRLIRALNSPTDLEKAPVFRDNILSPFLNRVLIRLVRDETQINWIDHYQPLTKQRFPKVTIPPKRDIHTVRFEKSLQQLNALETWQLGTIQTQLQQIAQEKQETMLGYLAEQWRQLCHLLQTITSSPSTPNLERDKQLIWMLGMPHLVQLEQYQHYLSDFTLPNLSNLMQRIMILTEERVALDRSGQLEERYRERAILLTKGAATIAQQNEAIEPQSLKHLLRRAAEETQVGDWDKAISYLEQCDQTIGVPIYGWQGLREATFEYHTLPADDDWSVLQLRAWLTFVRDVETNQAFFNGLRPNDKHIEEANRWYIDFKKWFAIPIDKRHSLWSESRVSFDKPYSLLRLRLDSENRKDQWGYNFVPSNLEYTNRSVREAYLQYRAQLIQNDMDRMEEHLIHLATLNVTQRISYLQEHERYKSNVQKQCQAVKDIARNLRNSDQSLIKTLEGCCIFWDQINKSPADNKQLVRDVTNYFNFDSMITKHWKAVTATSQPPVPLTYSTQKVSTITLQPTKKKRIIDTYDL